MRCSDCKRELNTGIVDFPFYLQCPHCRTPNLVVPRHRGTRASATRPSAPKRSAPGVNTDPTRAADFVRDGVIRGGHWPEHESYVVSVNLYGRLPYLLVEPRARPSARGRQGREQPLGGGLDEVYRAFSVGLAMSGRVFGVELARLALANTASLRFLEVASSTDARSSFTVACGHPRDALALAPAVLEVLDGLVASGATFADAVFDELGVRSDEVIAPEALARLIDKLSEVTHWLSGPVARVGDAIEGRLSLTEMGDELNGTLRVAWRAGDAATTDLSLDAALPLFENGPEHGALELWAEGQGLWALVRGRLEPRLADPALDAALHVKGDVTRAHELAACRDLCLRLAARDAHMVLDGARLRLRVPAKQRSFEELHAVADDALRLWRRLSLARIGAAAPAG